MAGEAPHRPWATRPTLQGPHHRGTGCSPLGHLTGTVTLLAPLPQCHPSPWGEQVDHVRCQAMALAPSSHGAQGSLAPPWVLFANVASARPSF